MKNKSYNTISFTWTTCRLIYASEAVVWLKGSSEGIFKKIHKKGIILLPEISCPRNSTHNAM